MIKTNALDLLWDLCIVTESYIMSWMSRGGIITGLEVFNGDSVDISKFMEFKLYDLIWYWDNQEATDNLCICRWLGVSHLVGSELCYGILTDKGIFLSLTKFQHVTMDETKETNIAEKLKDYKYTLDGNLSDPKYIYTEYDFHGFIMYDYLLHHIYQRPNDKW